MLQIQQSISVNEPFTSEDKSQPQLTPVIEQDRNQQLPPQRINLKEEVVNEKQCKLEQMQQTQLPNEQFNNGGTSLSHDSTTDIVTGSNSEKFAQFTMEQKEQIILEILSSADRQLVLQKYALSVDDVFVMREQVKNMPQLNYFIRKKNYYTEIERMQIALTGFRTIDKKLLVKDYHITLQQLNEWIKLYQKQFMLLPQWFSYGAKQLLVIWNPEEMQGCKKPKSSNQEFQNQDPSINSILINNIKCEANSFQSNNPIPNSTVNCANGGQHKTQFTDISKHTEKEKLQIMHQWIQSGQSILQFSKQIGLSANKLYFWRDKYVTTGQIYKLLFNQQSIVQQQPTEQEEMNSQKEKAADNFSGGNNNYQNNNYDPSNGNNNYQNNNNNDASNSQSDENRIRTRRQMMQQFNSGNISNGFDNSNGNGNSFFRKQEVKREEKDEDDSDSSDHLVKRKRNQLSDKEYTAEEDEDYDDELEKQKENFDEVDDEEEFIPEKQRQSSNNTHRIYKKKINNPKQNVVNINGFDRNTKCIMNDQSSRKWPPSLKQDYNKTVTSLSLKKNYEETEEEDQYQSDYKEEEEKQRQKNFLKNNGPNSKDNGKPLLYKTDSALLKHINQYILEKKFQGPGNAGSSQHHNQYNIDVRFLQKVKYNGEDLFVCSQDIGPIHLISHYQIERFGENAVFNHTCPSKISYLAVFVQGERAMYYLIVNQLKMQLFKYMEEKEPQLIWGHRSETINISLLQFIHKSEDQQIQILYQSSFQQINIFNLYIFDTLVQEQKIVAIEKPIQRILSQLFFIQSALSQQLLYVTGVDNQIIVFWPPENTAEQSSSAIEMNNQDIQEAAGEKICQHKILNLQEENSNHTNKIIQIEKVEQAIDNCTFLVNLDNNILLLIDVVTEKINDHKKFPEDIIYMKLHPSLQGSLAFLLFQNKITVFAASCLEHIVSLKLPEQLQIGTQMHIDLINNPDKQTEPSPEEKTESSTAKSKKKIYQFNIYYAHLGKQLGLQKKEMKLLAKEDEEDV